jgi:hypothetical protein
LPITYSPFEDYLGHILAEISPQVKYRYIGSQLPAFSLCAATHSQARIQAAQYAHLPLCAFGADWVLDTCDALFARQLRETGHVLWAADSAQPDLASKPTDYAAASTLREQQRETQASRASYGVGLESGHRHLPLPHILARAQLQLRMPCPACQAPSCTSKWLLCPAPHQVKG